MSRIGIIFFFFSVTVLAQKEVPANYFWEAQYFYGTMLRHNKNVAHLVTEHPFGIILSYNRKTYGQKYWQQAYNYPDWGISFLFEEFRNETLGKNYGLYGHYNFYFFNRNLQLRLAQGIAYNTNPFDINTNFKNNVYGTKILISNYLLINYKREMLYKGVGVQAGLSFVHHSNGGFKAPNAGTNVVALNVGVLYTVDHNVEPEYISEENEKNYSEKIKYNFVLRGGFNEGDFYNLGQHPFLVVTAFVDKRLNYKSTIQFGAEVFFSKFLKKEIEYRSIAFNSSNLTGDEDYKRVGIFAGHEFRLGNFAIPTQLGYYVYWPYEYESRVYSRAGVKYYFTEKLFGMATVKSHAANAEAIEFGIGIRL
jgi:Lipid A 3-O-deacylase (PagL)